LTPPRPSRYYACPLVKKQSDDRLRQPREQGAASRRPRGGFSHDEWSRSHSRAALFALALLPLSASAQQSPLAALGDLQAPADLGPFQRRIAPQLLRAAGQVQVWVQLQDSPLAAVNADAKERGAPITAGGQRAWLGQLRDQRDALSYAAASLGGRELGRVSKRTTPSPSQSTRAACRRSPRSRECSPSAR
jgi:hypothetical protein